jgi:hypothetical protein
LIIAATPDDLGLEALKAALERVNRSYAVLIATETELDSDVLISPTGEGFYSGIILTEGGLSYFDGDSWQSAFSDEEWQLLWQYERDYKVRQAVLYLYPGTYPEDYGIALVASQDTNLSATTVFLSKEAKQVFPSLGKVASLTIQGAYLYLAKPEVQSSALVTPLLTSKQGNLVALLSTAADGRERLALTMAQGPGLEHTNLLLPDLLNWLKVEASAKAKPDNHTVELLLLGGMLVAIALFILLDKYRLQRKIKRYKMQPVPETILEPSLEAGTSEDHQVNGASIPRSN